MTSISGRRTELRLLKSVIDSDKAEFLAVYGRRRVGKTHLIREFFKDQGSYLEVVGLKDGSLADQLLVFRDAFQNTFYPGIPIQTPDSWRDAFVMLTKEIEKVKSGKIIIFIDELPWLATRKSSIIQQIDHFWNSCWCKYKNLILIVCGSAASWMLEKLIYAKGGLHNRITKTVRLLPFNLTDIKEYLHSRGIKLGNQQILELYMAMGGVPYYLNSVKKGLSASQNIDEVCFTPDGLLFSEFGKLFASLFGTNEVYVKIISEIGKFRYGISRESLLHNLKVTTGGRAYKRLTELEEAGFISGFTPYGKKTDIYYRLIDEYALFYLYWLGKLPRGVLSQAHKDYWLKLRMSPRWNTWAGYSFESVCFKHVNQITKKIGIDKIPFEVGSWRYVSKSKDQGPGVQIDLLFDRADGIISLCEIKFSGREFVLDKKYAMELEHKKELFRQHLKTKKQLVWTIIAANGIKKNAWSEDVITSCVTSDDLF